MLLPQVSSRAAYGRMYGDTQVWLPAMNEIAIRHNLTEEPLRQTLGSNIVYGFGDLIVKLFPPHWKDGFHAETVTLATVHGLPTPDIIAVGEIEGWPYFIATRLDGIPVAKVWQGLQRDEKRDIVGELGELMCALHNSGNPNELPDEWGVFLDQRITGAEDHHNVAEPWRSWVVQQLTGFREPNLQRVLLHGDLTGDHLLLKEKCGRWSVSGLIDFGDARIGHPYYDFAIPLLDYVYGEPSLSRVLLDAYGLGETQEVVDSLTKYCLLHEFATLDEHLERYPAESPEHFIRQLWGRTHN